MTAILVTDGEERSALAVVRSLGRAGYSVYVCASAASSLAGASRYARAEAAVASPLIDPDRFLHGVHELTRRWRISVLIPISEAALRAVLPARDRFDRVTVPFPSAETFRVVSDKACLLSIAHGLGIPTPTQRMLAQPDEYPDDGGGLAYPVVIKPSKSVAAGTNGAFKTSVQYAADREELARRLARLPAGAFPVLLQRRVVGPGIGIFVLRWKQDVLGVFAHRRIREKPPAGGVSVYRESLLPDPGLVQRSVNLLEHLDWQGVAMVEYKVDEATGEPCLMEINGRFWGSLQLAIDAGVDFPRLLVQAALGEAPMPVLEGRPGTRSRWLWGDVDHLITRLRRSAAQLDLPPNAVTRLRAVLEFFMIRRRDCTEVLRFSDMRPFLRETRMWIRAALGKQGPSSAHDTPEHAESTRQR